MYKLDFFTLIKIWANTNQVDVACCADFAMVSLIIWTQYSISLLQINTLN